MKYTAVQRSQSPTPGAEEQPSWRRVARFSGLTITTIMSIALLALHLTAWKTSGRLQTWISSNHSTIALIVQAMAALLGMIQTSAICEMINVVVRERLQTKAMRLNTLHFWLSVAQDRMDWDVKARLLLPLATFCVLTVVPAALWAGAIAPVDTEALLLGNVTVPAYGNFPSADALNGDKLYSPDQETRTKDGVFNYAVGRNLYGLLASAAASATPPDGSRPLRQKPFGAQYVFDGRSYGVGALIGLDSGASSMPGNVSTYDFEEVGYNPQVECIYNHSTAYVLQPQDELQKSGLSVWLATGALPNGNLTAPPLDLSDDSRRLRIRQLAGNTTLTTALPNGNTQPSPVPGSDGDGTLPKGNTTLVSALPSDEGTTSAAETSSSTVSSVRLSSETETTPLSIPLQNSGTAASSASTDTSEILQSANAMSVDSTGLQGSMEQTTASELPTETSSDLQPVNALAASDVNAFIAAPTSTAQSVFLELPEETGTPDPQPTESSSASDAGTLEATTSTEMAPAPTDMTSSIDNSIASSSPPEPSEKPQLHVEADPYVGMYGSDNIVAFGTPSKQPLDDNRYLAVAAGNNYQFLNNVRCRLDFVPTRFRVGVEARNRTISVEPLHNATAPDDINPSRDLVFIAMRQFTAIAHQSSSWDLSLLGESLRTNVANYQFARGSNDSVELRRRLEDSDTLSGVTESIEAMIDTILLGFGGAQAMVGQDTQSLTTQYTVPAIKFGQAGYIYGVLVLNILIMGLVITQGVFTRFWRHLPAFDCLDPRTIVLAASKGGSGLGHLADVTNVDESRVGLMASEKRTAPLVHWGSDGDV